ncbi:MAG: hypothetical protein HOQ01_00035 [Lysobacter sp.]|nr:hypothetical protein [Lysobacter sp.]
MRQVFSSARLENVEGIAKMLEEHGIEVRITHGRSYKGGWGGRRSYRDEERGGPLPAVWVIKSEDQPLARQLLRDAGLLDSTRGGSDSYLPDSSMHGGGGGGEVRVATPTRRAFRYKIGLLIAIVVAVALAWMASSRMGKAPTSSTTAQAPAAHAPAAPTRAASTATHAAAAAANVDPVPNAYPVDTPPVLATTLAVVELATHDAPVACLRIDGTPATQEVTATLPKTTRFECTDTVDANVLVLDVRGYRTDGSGTGTVELAVTNADQSGQPTTQVRTLLVRRVEAEWRVLRVLSVR